MSSKNPSVSIVIPVYNEERQLAACLDSIAVQTVRPLEVIIVDNNSTDNTVAIARRYPFVRVVSEFRQGVVHARNRGFNEARGDIIGRLDTDSRLRPDWVARLQQIFQDTSVHAVSGSIGFHDMPFPTLCAKVDSFFRHYLARSLASRNELFLYGANMGIRKEVWHELKGSLCSHPGFHEDIDMAAHFVASRFTPAFDDTLRVDVSARRVDSDPRSYYQYVFANSRTYAAHNLKGRYYMYPVEWATVLFYVVLRVLYRSYDPSSGRMSLPRLLRPANERRRVSPVSEAAS